MAAGSITWELLMKTASFETDSKKAEKRIKELKKEAEALGKSLGIAAAAGVTAMTYALRESINAMDQVGEAAERIGITTEALSGLQYAAQLSAVSAEELEAGMIKLAKAAADGNDAFAAMGVTTTDQSGRLKDTAELLSEVASKFAGYRDGAEKTALALEIFGKSGAKLIPLLNRGADGIAEFTAEAEALGVVVGTDAAEAAGALNDNLDRLQAVLTGGLRAGASELVPILLTISEYFLDAAKNGGALTGVAGGIKNVFQTVAVVGSDVAFVFKSVGKELGAMVAAFSMLIQGNLTAAREIKKAVRAEGEESRKELDAFQAKIMGVQTAFDAVARTGGASAEDWGSKIAAPIVTAEKKVKKARESIDKDAQAAIRAQKVLADEGERLAESLQTPLERKQASESNVGRLAQAGVISPETQRRALAEAEATYQDYVTRQRELLTEGLLTEEQEINASYERRRQMILALTEATETEKAAAIASISEQQEQKIAAARLARYKDLMTQEQQLTIDYTSRRRQIEDDDAVSQEQKMQYLTALAETYHANMRKLDEEDQAKREELSRQQIALVEAGFAGMADLAKAFAGEQSDTYKALFAVSKAFAIADITIKQSQAIAKAWGENNYWVAAGLTVGLAAQFAGLISSAQGASFGGTRADGGPVSEGRSYLVGERGPEMFTPSEGGRIVPNDALGGQQQQSNIRIVNAYDTSHVGDYMGSGEGERIIMNAVRRNGAALRAMVGA